MGIFHKHRKKNPLFLSEEEKEIVIEEITKRVKDMVYFNARKHTERLFNEIIATFMNCETGELYNISYTVTICAGDLQQIVARVRREKEEKGAK